MRLLRGQLVSNALALYAVQGLNLLVPLLVLPIMLRALGTRGYGSIMFAQSLMAYALILVEFGFNFTAARAISIARDRPAEVARIYWTTLAAKGLLLLVSATVIATVVIATPSFRQDWPLFAASSLMLVGNVVFPQWYLQGLERLKDASLLQAISRCIGAIALVSLVHSPQDAWLAAFLMATPQLLGAAAALALGKSLAPRERYRPTFTDIRAALGESVHMFASSISTALYLHTNTFVLGLMRGPEAVALYSVATRVTGFLQSLIAPMAQAAFPRASLLFSTDRAAGWALFRRMAWILIPAMSFISLSITISAPQIAWVLGGSGFSDVVHVLRITAITPVLVAVATLLAQIAMVNLRLTKPLFWIYLSVGILNLALLPWLISLYSASGAAIALVVAETLGPVLMLTVLWRRRRTL